MGPNVAATDGEVFHDVYKPASCVALLAHAGITTPEPARAAWLRRMYATRALRRNQPREAVALLTEALQEASTLKGAAAHMLQELLEMRADAHDLLQDESSRSAAAADRRRAASLRELCVPQSSTLQR
jgi:hypothetical protein